jgi:hypothetical protein
MEVRMSQPHTVVHIGLHKTATRFLQRALFRSLPEQRFLLNPGVLTQPLKEALRFPGEHNRDRAREAARKARAMAGERTLVISDPTISGDMWSSHSDYADNLALLRELFPEATIVYVVRRQSDWLQSAWRQSLVKEAGQPIESFLNFYDGEFRDRLARRVFGARNLEALRLRFLEIYCAYARAYGASNVYLFRQEDLRRRPGAVYERLAEALGLDSLPTLPERVSGNRAFSALSIRLFFPGTRRRRRRPTEADIHVPPDRRDTVGRRLVRRLRTGLIRHGFDRVIYRDWDFLQRHGMRAMIDAYYEQELSRTARAAGAILESGPSEAAMRMACTESSETKRTACRTD